MMAAPSDVIPVSAQPKTGTQGHLIYGGIPVPHTASWTAEETFHIGRCPHAKMRAIMQAEAQGQGKPRFSKPHAQRQRQAVINGLCDLCAKSLKLRTTVSLSHARVRLDGATGPCIMQVEPLLHRECAAISVKHCTALRRDIAAGTLAVRQVSRYQVQIARMSKAYGLEIAGQAVEAAGHAKVILLAWTDRDQAWLTGDHLREAR